jgi:hypothetical protein
MGGARQFRVDQLKPFRHPLDIGNGYEATTIGGLVSELEGAFTINRRSGDARECLCTLEVVASTDRRVDTARISPGARNCRTGRWEEYSVLSGSPVN